MKTSYLLAAAVAFAVFCIYRHKPNGMADDDGQGVNVGPSPSGEALPGRTAVDTQETLERGQFQRGKTLSPPGTATMRFGSTAGGGSKIAPNAGEMITGGPARAEAGALRPPGSYPIYRKR